MKYKLTIFCVCAALIGFGGFIALNHFNILNRTGVVTEQYSDGTIKSKTTYFGGRKINVKLYKNGRLQKEEFFENDKLVRECWYYENGIIETDKRYRGGVIKSTTYNDINNIRNNWTLYKNGKIEKKRWYFKNGQMEYEKSFKNGELTQESGFYENGDLHWVIGYNTKENILFKKMYDRGYILDAHISYENGKEEIIYIKPDLLNKEKFLSEKGSDRNQNKEIVESMF
ncbi:MAG: hypothetical protein NT145_05370, partial [Elusimicrobia bacterium]|nr:hypothetical protein [Elusimicrobiota bacterium]